MRVIFSILTGAVVWVVSCYIWLFVLYSIFSKSSFPSILAFKFFEYSVNSLVWYVLTLGLIFIYSRSGLYAMLLCIYDNVRKPIEAELNYVRWITKDVEERYKKLTGKTIRRLRIRITDSLVPEALVLGNDTLVVSRGLLGCNRFFFAGIIAHEFGHFHYGDSIKKMDLNLMKTLKCLLLPPLFFILANGWKDLLFERIVEYRADDFTVKLGYGAEYLAHLEDLHALIIEDYSFAAELDKTHPGIADRIRRLEKKLQKQNKVKS